MKIILLIALTGCAAISLNNINAQTFTNADFEDGPIGFTSDYEFADSNSAEGQFTVRNDPQNWNGEFVNFGDHSSGDGKMLVVNGALSGDLAVWRQTIPVRSDTPYLFRAWTGSAVAGGPANLLLKVNGAQVGSSFELPNGTGNWVLWKQDWTSSASATVTFEIVNANTSQFPNDFYIDDVALVAISPELFGRLEDGKLELSWQADRAWKLFATASIMSGSWVPVSDVPTTIGILNTLRLPIPAPQQFFRLQRIP